MPFCGKMRSSCDPGEGGIGWVSSWLAIYQTLSSECPSYRGASSALLQLVNPWLNFVKNDPLIFSYSADHLLVVRFVAENAGRG